MALRKIDLMHRTFGKCDGHTLRSAADNYENGELIEVRDLLQDIVDAIDEFESEQEW